MTEYINPPFIHKGMLIWIEMKHPVACEVYVPCEILEIKEKTVEVCDLSTRTCMWLPHKDILVKMEGHPSVTYIPDSKFLDILAIDQLRRNDSKIGIVKP